MNKFANLRINYFIVNVQKMQTLCGSAERFFVHAPHLSVDWRAAEDADHGAPLGPLERVRQRRRAPAAVEQHSQPVQLSVVLRGKNDKMISSLSQLPLA